MRDGFIFYRSFYESAKALNDDDRLALYEAIFELALNQNETKSEPMVNAFLNLIKPQIEANNRRFENGKKGGRPPNTETKTKPNNNQDETKTKPKEKVKEKVKEKDNEKGKDIVITQKSSDDSIRLANYLLQHIVRVNPTFKQPNINTWAKDIDLAIRIDGRTAEELKNCIEWIYTNKGAFWQKNILSGKKLREKFDTMNMQVISTKNNQQRKVDIEDIYSKGLTATEVIAEMIRREKENI